MNRREILRLLPLIVLLISLTANAGVGDANSWREVGIGGSGSWWVWILAVIFVFGASAGGGYTMMIVIAFVIGATLAQWFGGAIGMLGGAGFLVWIYRTNMPSASKEKLSNEQPSSIVIGNEELGEGRNVSLPVWALEGLKGIADSLRREGYFD